MWLLYNRDEKLYWSDDIGWGDKTSATRFSEAEKNTYVMVPLGSQWVHESHVDEAKDDLFL